MIKEIDSRALIQNWHSPMKIGKLKSVNIVLVSCEVSDEMKYHIRHNDIILKFIGGRVFKYTLLLFRSVCFRLLNRL